MKKTLLIGLVALCTLFSSQIASAQENGNRDANGNIVTGPYLTNKFWDNWFIQFGGGAAMYLGWQNQKFAARIRPQSYVGFGKWFTPTVGARINFNYTHTFREYPGVNTAYTIAPNSWQKFSMWNLHADFLWNFSNAVSGYKETRTFEIIPYVGAGIARTFNKDLDHHDNEFALNAGFINKFRVSDLIDINLELAATGASTRLDNAIKGKIDIPVAALVGINFKLGKTKGFQRAKIGASDDALAAKYAQLMKDLDAANARNKALADENANLKNKLANMPAPKDLRTKHNDACILFFKINEAVLSQKELTSLEVYANSIKPTLDKDNSIKVEIIGSADKGTGTPEYNQTLSEKRAEYVKNILVEKYGFDASRISTKGEGETNNSYTIPALNRTAKIYLQ